MTDYDLRRHKHSFACWAAGSAAGTSKLCRFKVETGRSLLTAMGFDELIDAPDKLPLPQAFDDQHRVWRNQAKAWAADRRELITGTLTDGVAAKLINVYLKVIFVCGGHESHPSVQAIHPPIERLLLQALAQDPRARRVAKWDDLSWSTFDGARYERVIANVRLVLDGNPLWMIEQHWAGFQ